MTGYRLATAAASLSLLTVTAAHACPAYLQPNLTEAREADAVVVGYVTKDVREMSPARRAWIEKSHANSPFASREDRRIAGNNRARLTVEIDHAIAGTAPSTITVYWYRMTNNGPPERINGGYVFALRKESPSTSADGDDAYAVMQGECRGALVFRRGSAEANAIREMFGLSPEPLETPRNTLAESFEEPPMPWPTPIIFGLLATGAALIGLVALWPRRPRP